MSKADDIREHAEKKRDTERFAADHPAVRAAKRYCERTGAGWRIGVGGRCELGKRAIKQWVYEAWQQVANAWSTPRGKLLMLGVPVAALLLLGLLISAEAVLTGLGVTFVIVAALVSITLGVALGSGEYSWSDIKPDWQAASTAEKALIVFLGLAAVAGSPLGVVAYVVALSVQMRAVRIAVKSILVVALACVVGMLLYVLYLAVIQDLWGSLVVALWIVGIICVIFGGARLIQSLRDTRAAKRREAMRAARADAEALQMAYERLKPFLKTTYQNIFDGLPERNVTDYDTWVCQVEIWLAMSGLAWVDLLQYESDRHELWRKFDISGYYSVIVPLTSLYGYGEFIDDLHKWQRTQLPLGKQRWVRTRQVGAFIGATLFLVKTKFCPNVDLPDWDKVDAGSAS